MDRPGSRRSMWFRPWLIALAAASLCACQGLPQPTARAGKAAEPPVPSWRVVERLGQARYLSASMSGWEPVEAGRLLPAGSQISTGIGGRLILAQAANQMIAGTSSRFILPGWQPGASVRQTAGWLRYRIAGAPSSTFGIETPFLDLAVGDAVLDVTVADSETEVAVVSGRVHVKTLDDRRQINLEAGHVGYASLHDHPLALRRGPGATLEPVPVTVIPALHPGRQALAASDPAATGQRPPDLLPERASEADVTPDMLPRMDPRLPVQPAATRPAAALPPALTQRFATTQRAASAGSSAPSNRAILAMAAPATIAATVSATPRAQETAASVLPAGMTEPGTALRSTDDVGGSAIAAAAPETIASSPAGLPNVIEPDPGTALVRTASTTSQSVSPPVVTATTESPDQVRRRFDLLTEGLLDGLAPARAAVPGARR